jgi:hypothetical protein
MTLASTIYREAEQLNALRRHGHARARLHQTTAAGRI